jgi:hypothetical protein
MDYYYNYEPGRLRIRTPYIYHNEQQAGSFKKTVGELKGMVLVETNPVTGSALIHFDEHILTRDQLLGFLEKHGYFIMAKAKTLDEVIEHAVEKVLEEI